jgi:hypothetical protein
MSRTRAPASRISAMPVVVARAVEDDDHDVAHVDLLALGHEPDRLRDRAVQVEQVADVRAARELLHVDARARVEHRPARATGR